jgi:hypothetical protein
MLAILTAEEAEVCIPQLIIAVLPGMLLIIPGGFILNVFTARKPGIIPYTTYG